ncbi:MAG: FAD-binding protein [Acidimicrobiales bacterium]
MTDAAAGAVHRTVRSLREAFGDALECSVSLAAYSTYRVGGAAAALLHVHSIDDLLLAYSITSGGQLPTLVVGKGSNLVVADRGFPGLVLWLGEEFGFIDVEVERSTVTAGGAAFLPVVARRATSSGLAGFTWAVGVPGSVGGAVRMNAGGHGSDMAATLVSATVFDLASGELSRRSVAELGLGYRTSAITASQIVLDATLQLAPGDREAGERDLAEIVRWRREHQPGGANGGSVFANPEGGVLAPSSMPLAAKECALARRRCQRSTPISSWPTPVARPTTSSADRCGSSAGP